MLSQPARFGTGSGRQIHGEFNTLGASADLSGTHSARMNIGTKRVAVLLGGSLTQHNDLRAGQGSDSHNVYRRFFGLNNDQVRSVFGDRLQNTGFMQYSSDATVAARLSSAQTLTLRYLRSDIQNGRSYRDTYGGANRMKSLFDPQSLNFGYARYEAQKAGPLDSFSATASINQQSDGAIVKGALLTDVETADRSRVTSRGYASQATAHIGSRQAIVFGGEVYDERILSTRFNLDPVAASNIQDRALYPNNSRYITSGLFIQGSVQLWNNRLHATTGVRYTGVRYTTRAADNTAAGGRSLGVTDSARTFSDVSFNAGLQWTVTRVLAVDGNVSRGFRAPNVNDLGGVGAKTLGYDVIGGDAIAVNALLGTDATDTPLPTGRRIAPLKPETLMSYELGFRIQTSKLYFRSHYFDSELRNPILSRTLLFPVGQAPAAIGGVAVTPIAQSAGQRAQGVVSVVTNLTPRAVRTAINDGKTRYFGTDNTLRYRLNTKWTVSGSYSFLGGLDLEPLRPTRRLPPQEGGAQVLFAPGGGKPWIEFGIRAAGSQARFSQADFDDDRIGGSRRRSDIAAFFRSNTVASQIAPGGDGRPGTADDVFTPTNETLRQIQDRVLPLNTTINGVVVAADSVRIPLYTSVPRWSTVNIRGGFTLAERTNVTLGVNNLFDNNYRSIGSGVDAPGFNVYAGIRYIF